MPENNDTPSINDRIGDPDPQPTEEQLTDLAEIRAEVTELTEEELADVADQRTEVDRLIERVEEIPEPPVDADTGPEPPAQTLQLTISDAALIIGSRAKDLVAYDPTTAFNSEIEVFGTEAEKAAVLASVDRLIVLAQSVRAALIELPAATQGDQK